MQRDMIIKGRSLGGCSDLTLLAPIKQGFVESLESVTYKTRIKRVLEILHGARMAAHEHHTARLLSDAVERVGAIHSVRVAVLEPEDKVLLAVTFDGSWESYIRVLWDKVGPLLDLIFCGTVDYVTAHGHSFDEWLDWARRVQVETGFFYGPPESTARDALYLRRVERMRGRGMGGAVDELRAVLPSAEQAMQRCVDPPKSLAADDPQIKTVAAVRMVRERVRNGLRGLTVLYRLADLHRPGTDDGDVLRRAALDLLQEFVRMRDRGLIDQPLADEHGRFERQLDWLFPGGAEGARALVKRRTPLLPESDVAIDPAVRKDVQGGILRSYKQVTHGLLLMLAFDNAAALGVFLRGIETDPAGVAWLTRDSDPHEAEEKVVFRNLAFTAAGLRAAGIGEDELELFPEEFRQGMAARAGLLGDVRNNHPHRWHLPHRFTSIGDETLAAGTIDLDGVQAVLQLRCMAVGDKQEAALELSDSDHPLRPEVETLLEKNPGLRLLAVQPLRRRYEDRKSPGDDGTKKVIVEHFGYADGDGQPDVEWSTTPKQPGFKRNRVHLGEVLVGHDSAADSPVDLSDPAVAQKAKDRQRWLANGSFLAMRKYRQFASRLDRAVWATAASMAEAMDDKTAGVHKTAADYVELVYAKLMGRYRSNLPLIDVVPDRINVFTYDLDPAGEQCPLHAHIRRVHPRLRPGETARAPRLMRRSMAYGPAVPRPAKPVCDDAAKDSGGSVGKVRDKPLEPTTDDADRGLVFMAYNASLGEQFEVAQRWLTGGNSTGSSSGTSCPIVGVPENGLPRYFRFEHSVNGTPRVFSVQLEEETKLFDEAKAATRLEWGLYLFAPSLTALRRLRAAAESAAAVAPAAAATPWQTARGRQLMAALRHTEAKHGPAAALDAWKEALEDPEWIDRLESASIWAAIREDHGGVLRTPYGVLVGDRDLLSDVFADPHKRYSVSGQLGRMRRSFGEIALGMDDSPLYWQLSHAINNAIGKLSEEEVFALAFKAADKKLGEIVGKAKEQSEEVRDSRFEANFDIREVLDEVLATLSEEWFGLADDPQRRFRKGGADWTWQPGEPPLYPGHFTALSRYMFQPNPGPMAVELGESYGLALRGAMRCFVADHRRIATVPKRRDGTAAPLAQTVFGDPAHQGNDDLIARTMVGVLMGFNPTIIGAVLNVLREWQRVGSLGTLRALLAGRTDFAAACKVLAVPMAAAARMRPMPQLGWRTALKAHRLGKVSRHAVDVVEDDRIVLGIVSGTQQSLADGEDDGRLMFGGVRSGARHPTHACPGYAAGIGAMLGTLTALLARTESLRPGVASLTFLLEGDMPPVKPIAPPEWKTPRSTAEPGSKGLVLAWGDSWLDFSYEEVSDLGSDLRDWLEYFGYKVPTTYCKYSVWPKARTLAAHPEDFCADLDSFMLAPNKPVAIVLSAGGNDSTGDALRRLLNCKASASTQGVLNETTRKTHIADLRASYEKVLHAIGRVFKDHECEIPVFVHGYDHPLPRGHSDLMPNSPNSYAAKWLRDPFKDKGYDLSEKDDMEDATHAMRELIDDLNRTLSELSAAYPFVHYVNLRETIKDEGASDPEVHWFDDLHPTTKAFHLFAEKIDKAITSVVKKNG